MKSTHFIIAGLLMVAGLAQAQKLLTVEEATTGGANRRLLPSRTIATFDTNGKGLLVAQANQVGSSRHQLMVRINRSAEFGQPSTCNWLKRD
jgi:hypothetical protein